MEEKKTSKDDILTLEQEKNQLLNKYGDDELILYSDLIQQSNQFLVDGIIKYDFFTKEDSSNG